MSRVLITGGGGFIGCHLAAFLAERGEEVHLVDDLSRGVLDDDLRRLLEMRNVTFQQLNLITAQPSDFAANFDVIFHLSAIVGVQNVVADPARVLRDNVRMLLPMLEVARGQDQLGRFVFASTSEVYAGTLEQFGMEIPTPESTPLTVTDLGAPRTSYMLSKIYGEALTRQSGIPFTIVRPHNIYGPRMGLSHVIPELLRKAHAAPDDGSIDVSSVDHRRTFCFVSDAVRMLDAVAREPRGAGEVLNIGAQQPEVSIGELARLVIKCTSKQLSVIAKASTPGSPPRRCPDMSRLKALTGYEALVDLETGIRRTYDWYRDREFTGSAT